MADKETTLRVVLDHEGAVKGYQNLEGAQSSFMGAVEKGSGSFSVFGGLLAGFAGGLAVSAASAFANIGAKALSAINPVDLFFDAIERSDQLDDVSSGFNRLSEAAGATADTFLEQLNKAAQDSVTNLQLMKNANDSLNAGLKPDAIVTLTAAAKTLADQTGGDTTQAFKELSGAIETGRTAGLRARGIFVDSQDVIRQWAEENRKAGESVEQAARRIDEQTKVQLIQAQVIDQVKKKYGELGTDTKSLGDKLETTGKHWEDLKDTASQFVEQVPLVGEALDLLNDFLKNSITFIQFWGNKTGLILEAFSIGWQLNLRNAEKSIEEFSKALTLGFSPAADENIRRIDQDIAQLSERAADVARGMFGAVPPTKDLTEQINKLNQGIEDFNREGSGAAGTVETIGKSANVSKESLAEFGNVAEQAMDRLADAGAVAQDQIKKLDEEALRAGEQFGNIFGQGLSRAIEGDLAGALDTILSGFSSKLGETIGASFGTALGSLGGPIGAAVGGSIGSLLSEQISNDFSKAAKGDFNDALRDILIAGGPLAIANLPTLGLGSLIASKIMGGDNEGTQFRKAVDKFFADAFEANHIQAIIDGQLQEITDLDFSGTQFGDASSGFFEAFDGLSEAARAGFAGVAQGFTTLLGQGEEFAGSLAAVFANNIGGSLNNLQLLVEASGVSFEQLREQIVDAFLDGKLSALQAQTALNGIAQVSQKGIPDGLGLTATAFDNLKAAGVNGGRALVDALQDIGVEAGELEEPITTLDDLQANLVASGVSAEEAATLIKALGDNGIDSVQELAAATAEDLLPVLSQLQAINFPFAEAAKETDGLAESINNLPSEKTVKIRVVAEYENGADQVIQQVSGNSSSFASSRSVGYGA